MQPTDRQARARGHAGHHAGLAGRNPGAGGGGGGHRRTLGVGAFLCGETVEHLAEALQGLLCALPIGRKSQGVAVSQPETEQADEVAGVGGVVAMAHLQPHAGAPRCLDPLRGRARVQTGRVGQHPVQGMRQVVGRRARRRRGFIAQRQYQIGGPGGDKQRSHAAVVLDQTGQTPQQGDVAVGLGCDRHDQPCVLARIPFDALRHLQDGDAVAQDQVAVLAQSVGDGHAVTEKGVGHLFALKHAGGEARCHAAAGAEQLAGFADRGLLARRLGAQADARFRYQVFGGRCSHLHLLSLWLK